MSDDLLFDDFGADDDDAGTETRDEVELPEALPALPPQANPDLIGHGAIEEALLGLINAKRFPHALIFAGPEGVGKATCAFRLVRSLLSLPAEEGGGLFGEAPPPLSSLAVPVTHPVFGRVAAGGHPDLRFIERPFDEAKGARKASIPVEDIRKIPSFLRMTPAMGGWRAVIVDDADTLNRSAQNALLKILEEPPDRSILILIAHRPGMLIPTIRSRCRVYSFSALDEGVVRDLLRRAHPGLDSVTMDLLTGFSGGSVGVALRFLEEGGAETARELAELLAEWPVLPWVKIHALAEDLARPARDLAYRGFRDVLQWMTFQILHAAAAHVPLRVPAPLDRPARAIAGHYSLEAILQICENLKDHFETAEQGALDRKVAVLGAFSRLSGQAAAA